MSTILSLFSHIKKSHKTTFISQKQRNITQHLITPSNTTHNNTKQRQNIDSYIKQSYIDQWKCLNNTSIFHNHVHRI